MSDTVCGLCSNRHSSENAIRCKSDSTIGCYHITWTISNFSFIVKEEGEFISSSTFVTGAKLTKWYLKLYPNGYSSDADVGLYIENLSNSPEVVKYSCSIINKEKTKNNTSNSGITKIDANSGRGFPEFIFRDELFKTESGLLPNDTLTILCELQVIDDLKGSCSYKKNIGIEEVCQDLKELLTSCDLSDVTISIGIKKYPAHRTILAARSPVFAATFKHDFLENRTNVIEVTDIEPKVMEQVLHYIYTGSCPEIKEMAGNLLAPAEKYDLAGLKKLCEETLSELLDPENAAATLIAADLYNLKQLREGTLDYICKHIKEVHHTSGWNKMTQSHQDLELEVLRALMHKCNVNL